MIEEIKKRLEAGEVVELECINKEGFISKNEVNKEILNLEEIEVQCYLEEDVDFFGGLQLIASESFLEDKGLIISDMFIRNNEIEYFEIIESPYIGGSPTFDDLIDSAVKAQKYGLIHKVEMIGRRSLYLSEKPTSKALHYCLTSIEDGINFINSLYTETFIIEGEEDISRVRRGAEIVLANGSAFAATFVTQLSRGWVVDSVLGNLNQTYCLFLLKGATVTQKRGK